MMAEDDSNFGQGQFSLASWKLEWCDGLCD